MDAEKIHILRLFIVSIAKPLNGLISNADMEKIPDIAPAIVRSVPSSTAYDDTIVAIILNPREVIRLTADNKQ